jgi:hypothetical protein
MTAPPAAPDASPGKEKRLAGAGGKPPPPPPVPAVRGGAGTKLRRRLFLGAGLAAGLLAVAGLALLVYSRDAELNDLKSNSREVRREALVTLAQADLDASRRPQVTAALEPLIFTGDVRHELSPDLVLRAYLHWAGPDNIPAMIRMAQSSSLPGWTPKQTALVMQSLGALGSPEAIDVLAGKLADPALRDQAVDALRLIGPKAENAVLAYAFDAPPETRLRANQLLAEYGFDPKAIAGEALARLKSTSPEARREAAVWFAENPPVDEGQQAEVSRALAGQLDDLSPAVDALALRALSLWATKDCLPQVTAFAKRQEKADSCPPELLDVLARFPDAATADAIALRLANPATRPLAVRALAKMGPSATQAVLRYLDDPDPGVRKEAHGLCGVLNIPDDVVLKQTLADVGDAHKPVCRIALEELARLRPDGANRTAVSRALNAPLLDPDPTVRSDALNAIRVWGTKENTSALLRVLGKIQVGTAGRDPRVLDSLISLQDPAAAPALAEGLACPGELDRAVKALTAMGPAAEEAVIPYLQSGSREARFAACWILGEIGTSKSVRPLEAAGAKWFADGEFYVRTRDSADQITARK